MSVKSDNLRIWDALGKTDPKHTKQFTRAGGFKGTAIKPMWANKQMTEFFGPAGIGWGMTEPVFNVVPAGEEVMVYCTVSLWHGEARHFVYGVGGDKVVSLVFVKDGQGNKVRGEDGKFKTYPQTDDEAFKKAYTDALSNAMKFIGVGADVHMGQFEDNKYVREVAAEFDEAKKAEVHAEVERQKASHKPESYPTLDPSEAHVGPSPELSRALKAEEVAQDDKYHVPPELDWSYQKSSGVLICRIVDAQKKTTTAAGKPQKEYVVLTVNNELDKGKKPLLYYWHATHRDALLAAKGKVVKLLVIAKEKGFTVDAVMEINHVKVGLEDSAKEGDTGADGGSTNPTTQTLTTKTKSSGSKSDPEVEMQCRLLASVIDTNKYPFTDENLRELHAMCKYSWPDVLEALKVRKAEVEAGVEAGSR